MEQIQCVHCGDFFKASPRHKNQTACKKKECQRAGKKGWHRFKMKTDPDYRAGQKISQKQWARANPHYWKQYRKKNPRYAERNRILQSLRNRKNRASEPPAKMDTPLIAKMDALKVNIARIPIYYP